MLIRSTFVYSTFFCFSKRPGVPGGIKRNIERPVAARD